MTTAASDDSPAPADKPRLFKLAIAGLLLSAIVQIACLAVIRHRFTPPDTTFVGINIIHFVTSAIVIFFCAHSSAIVPAVLAAFHVAFRAVLIGLHVLLTGTIMIGSEYVDAPYLPPDAMATSATGDLLVTAGITAGLVAGMVLHATLFGWVLTRDAESAVRPTFSLRGMLIATAVTAVVLASPRFVPHVAALLIGLIHPILSRETNAVVTVDSSLDGGVLLGTAGVIGFLLTINFSAAVWCLRGRRGYRILAGVSLAFCLLGLLADMTFGGGNAGLGMGVALAVSLFGGSLMTTAQTAIWQRFGWRLVHIRRDSTLPAG